MNSKNLQPFSFKKDPNNDFQDNLELYKIYPLMNYRVNQNFIDNNGEEYELDELIEILESHDKGYHNRINPNSNYKFFGDCDNYKKSFEDFSIILVNFLKKNYRLVLDTSDICFTENKSKRGSYHYVIPKYYANCKKIKEIHENLLKENKTEFIYNGNNKTQKVIDTTIYSNHWFRCPNQSKEGKIETKHIIKKGQMRDFIIENIKKDSICLDYIKFINRYEDEPIKEIKIKKSKKNENHQQKNISEKEQSYEKFKDWTIIYKFFDECYKKERFELYEYWTNVGMAIKNRYGKDGFELFKYFSNKATNPDNEQQLIKKYDSFQEVLQNPITIKIIYYYAKEDNKEKFIEIIKMESYFKDFNLTSTDVANYIKLLKPNYFVWKEQVLYCFNGKYWEKNDLLMRIYISTELYDFLKDMLATCFWNNHLFEKHKRLLENLKKLSFKKEIVETTREYLTNNEIEFDNKYYLFGFKNIVYDLREHNFREYKYDDFVSTTTGYDWIEPNTKQIDKMTNLISKIFPIENERNLFLEILSSGLEGRSIEKCIIFNGNGRNGKGLLNDIFLKSLGEYGLIANNAILFEKNKTGSNPEKNNLHKKRYVVFREPSASSKLENSVVKELTGGGKFSARGHHETSTEKKLHMTMIIECNKRPLFAEEPQRAEIERLIDLYFRSTFTDNLQELDDNKNIYKANVKYKTDDFQELHKHALIKIIFSNYKKYATNNFIFDIPDSIRQRTNSYLEMSCNILGWINEQYEKTDNKKDIIKLKDVFYNFKESEYYFNLSKSQKRLYNYQYFIKQFSENIFFAKYYQEKYNIFSNVLTFYIKKEFFDEI